MLQITSTRNLLHGIADSGQGGRRENQDDMGFMETPLGFLIVVCDGMGGGPGGRTASYIAKCELMRILSSCSPQASRVDVLKMAVSKANDALYRKMEEMPSLRGMGTTLVAILINETSAVVAHLGDSRCYRLEGKHVLFRTKDHSLVGELVRRKAMTEEQARVSPQSNVITRALGNTENHVVEIDEVPYRKGDRFVLCTDGVWGIMSEPELIHRLSMARDIYGIASSLSSEIDQIGFAQGGHHDNHTLVIIEMNTDSILKDKMNKQTKILLGTISCLLAISIIFNLVCLKAHPQQEALEKAYREIERLTPYENLYHELSEKEGQTFSSLLHTLQFQNDSLQKCIAVLVEKLDSLKDATVSKEQEVTKGNASKSVANQPMPPKEIVRVIIDKLVAMKNAKAKNIRDVVKKKDAYRNEVLRLLQILNEQTGQKYASAIQEIKNGLSKDATSSKVDQKDGNGDYKSTLIAQKAIDSLIEKVKKISNKIE